VKLLKLHPEKSNRQIAKAVSVSHPHVGKVRAEAEQAGDVETVSTSVDTKGRNQPVKRKCTKSGVIAGKAVVKKPTSDLPKAPTPPVREAVAPDEELLLLREFGRFVIERTTVRTDPKDYSEWKVLLGRVKAILLGGSP
jgi:hypothetical protein